MPANMSSSWMCGILALLVLRTVCVKYCGTLPASGLQTAFPIGFFSVLDRPFKDLTTWMRFPKVEFFCMNRPDDPVVCYASAQAGTLDAQCHSQV